MKKLLITLTMCSILSNSASAMELSPLAGSEWAMSNPGLLPYKSCEVKKRQGGWYLTSSWGIIVGDASNERGELRNYDMRRFAYDFYLECKAPKIGVAYSIPIRVVSSLRAGPMVRVLESDLFTTGMAVSGLDGKTVNEFYGDFRGVEVGAGLLLGAGARRLRHHGISLKGASAGFSLTAAVNYIRLTFEPFDQISGEACRIPYVLSSGATGQVRDPAGCPATDNDQAGVRSYLVDTASLGALRFVKVK